ncbi:MAG TPA: arginine deiminase family protein [Candidatus Limnocylindrales bacterium]|nr:arginine deiminase family protein [Candidatus Limnocylindrales bacterium]
MTVRAAIVRPPSARLASGITTSSLGAPDIPRALEQHREYVAALERAGVRVTLLDPDPEHPDSTFVEDTAVVCGDAVILTRPGAPSRRGEVDSVRSVLEPLFKRIHAISAPATLDGGDVLDVEDRVLIGVSERTNDEGSRQLAGFLAREGIASSTLDIRGAPGLLHLKTGISSLGSSRVLAVETLRIQAEAMGLEVVVVPPEEAYAANCVLVNGHLLLAAGFPTAERALLNLGLATLTLEMSEFQKMDGGLSCLSLRLP